MPYRCTHHALFDIRYSIIDTRYAIFGDYLIAPKREHKLNARSLYSLRPVLCCPVFFGVRYSIMCSFALFCFEMSLLLARLAYLVGRGVVFYS